MPSVQNGYKEEFSWEELVEFQVVSLPGYELGSRGIRIESSSGVGICSRELRESAVEGDWEEMARKDRRLHVCCSDSETVINPLPGYD
jgi:hypothetical protein